MPSAFPATIAEREAELVALQSAFDEYIASSRELEEELDAELAKMQEKLAESTAANAALSAQLETISPQLSSLETSLTESRQKLKEEQKLRRAAEQAQDEADQRLREMEQTLHHLREECDFVHEELAFKENELEESKLELEVEKQQLQDELTTMRSSLAALQEEVEQVQREKEQANYHVMNGDQSANKTPVPSTSEPVPFVDENYVRKLEEELELVTEQLIDTEKRLTDGEAAIAQYKQTLTELQQHTRTEEDDDLIRNLQASNADLLTENQRLRDDLDLTKEELTLAREECQLQQEELQAVEHDSKSVVLALEEARVKHREEVNALIIKVKEAEASSNVRLEEAAIVASGVKATNEENIKLRDQLIAVEQALKNAHHDYQSVIDELDAVNSRFDEVREEAKRQAMDEMAEKVKREMRSDNEHEINLMKEQLDKLVQENHALQQKVDETEVELAAAKDRQKQGVDDGESELSKQLQSQLNRLKTELADKDKELVALTETFEDRIKKAEDNMAKLENDLRITKGQLAEAEANLIVLRREKESAEKKNMAIPTKSTPYKTQISKGSSYDESIDREELDFMDEEPTPLHVRSRDRPRARSNSPTSVARLEIRLNEESEKLNALQKEFDALLDQKRMAEVRSKRLESDIKILQRELFSNGGETAVVTQMSRLSSLASKETSIDEMGVDDVDAEKIERLIKSNDLGLMEKELRALDKKIRHQREYNTQLLSKMLHLQGNIQVYCRIRPLTITEMQAGSKTVVEALSETEVGCFDERTNKWKSFAFDRVWGPDQSQQRVFQDVEPLALSVVDGYNACIFAYGQTGSGKTFTMEGALDNNQHGISYRTIQKIFHLLSLRAQQQRAAEMFVGENPDDPGEELSFTFSLELGMLEIYNDEVYDLLYLDGSTTAQKKEGAMRVGGKASLEVRRDKDGRIEVPNLTKKKVTSIQEVMDLLKCGNSNRATAATDMNEHSSRSHMVLIVDVYSGLGEAQQNKGTLFLVDLAGSERVRKSKVEGEQLKEAGFINKSLSALGNVMEALDRKASHVPYRDSKLTYLLQDSLGGNSRTMMVVAISPMDASHDESVHALQFATRVRRIQIGAAQRNVTAKNLEETVKALTEEMRALTRAKERTEGQLISLKRDNARVQDKLQNLSKSRQQNRTDSKTLDVLRKNSADMAKRWEKEKQAREETVEELENTRNELRSVQQQLAKATGKLQTLEKQVEDKENELESVKNQMRQDQNANAAAAVRSRRDQVLGNRTPAPSSIPGATFRGPAQKSKPEDALANSASAPELPSDVVEVRKKVLDLLEKYDSGKVDRIDIIMEKFKGKESLLLEKMTQRYEGAESLTTPSVSVQKRNEIALKQHQERMRRIREKKNEG